jgi:proline iminopeptidase
MMPDETGYLEVLGFRQYYRVIGPRFAPVAVLALHGGPGASHDYLLPLADLAKHGYRIVFFDQLGCGRSQIPSDYALFTLDHHVAETESVRTQLGLGRVHLIGSSYGGLLALAVALSHPGSLRSLTTVGGLASVPFAQQEMDRLRAELPEAVQATMGRNERDGTTSSVEYQAACRVFYTRHLCRIDPWPSEVNHSLEMCAERPVYSYMNGPSEFTITGTIRSIDLTPRLGQIQIPTLVLGGRYDEVTPRVADQIRSRIPGARSFTFEQSSHMPFWEERTRFMEVVLDFLRSVDASPDLRPSDQRGRGV